MYLKLTTVLIFIFISNFAWSEDPTDITSDKLTIIQSRHLAVFEGHVVAIRQGTALNAEVMKVYYLSNEDRGRHDDGIKCILLRKNVRLDDGDRVATGKYGKYIAASRKFFLWGGVKIVQGDNIITGEKLVYDFATKQLEVINQDKDRVRMKYTEGEK